MASTDTNADTTPTILPFYGTLILKDWIYIPTNGRMVKAVTGSVSVHNDEALVGFRVKGTESNWVATVRGTGRSGSEEFIHVLGCQIRGFMSHARGLAMAGETYVIGE